MGQEVLAYLELIGAGVAVVAGLTVLLVRSLREVRTENAERARLERSLAAMDQSWYWTDEWQAGEAAVGADLAAGRSTTYASVDEFLRGPGTATEGPTFESPALFDRDRARLGPDEHAAFDAAVRTMADELRQRQATGRGLPGRRIRGAADVRELRFTADGRATWQLGPTGTRGAAHVVWRRIDAAVSRAAGPRRDTRNLLDE